MTDVSRTIGESQIVDEGVVSFTHTTMIDWILPGVPPTGKPVEIAVAVIVGFKDGKVSHENIYWDQARQVTTRSDFSRSSAKMPNLVATDSMFGSTRQ